MFDSTYHGYGDGFIAKISNDGDVLIWCSFLGGGSIDEIRGVAVNESGDIVLTGATQYSATQLSPVTRGRFDDTHNSGFDAFVGRLSSD